jgi:hypothetical protein
MPEVCAFRAAEKSMSFALYPGVPALAMFEVISPMR